VVLLAALGVGLAWRLPDRLLAGAADRRLALRDRLSTALFLTGKPDPSGLEQAQVHDGLLRLAALHPREVFPLRAYRCARLSAGGLLALLAVQILPIPPLLLSAQAQQDRAVVRLQGAQLEPVAQRLEQHARRSGDASTRELAQRLHKLSQDMQRGKLDRKQALLALREMDKTLQGNAPQPTPQLAQQAAEALQRSAQSALAKQAQQLAAQASKKGDAAAQKRLQDLAKQAQQASTPEQAQKVAEQLQREAKALGATAPGLGLSAALAQGADTGDWSAAADQLAQLQDALQSGKLSPEEAKQLAEQLAQAAQALSAAQQKELAQSLSQACQCLQQGDQKGACACCGKACSCAGKKGAACACGKCAGACASSAATGMGPVNTGAHSFNGNEYAGGPDDPRSRANPASEAGKLYAPRSVAVTPGTVRATGQLRPGAQMEALEERSAPDKVSASKVPYYEVVGDYSRAAEEALSREEVPPADRAAVRKYFEALQAGGSSAPAADPGKESTP
jgi:polyhydroxyalkanoate synthesis regulator phasin